MKLLLATTSPGKVREQKTALAGLRCELLTLDAFPGIESPAETGSSFRENAALKALYYHRATGLPTVAEDAGLEIPALGGFPGVQSARWLGSETSYSEKNSRLLELMSDFSGAERAARYKSAIALAAEGRIAFEAEGSCEGRIADAPRGEEGFGYDPVFYYPPLQKTMAELSAEEKDAVSHRGKAAALLRRYLEETGNRLR